MSTPLADVAAAAGDSLLPATGFGPATIIIALIGAVLTASAALARRLSRRPTPTT